MTKTGSGYWGQRQKDEDAWIQSNLASDDQFNKLLQTRYDQALTEIQRDIDSEYSKYAGKSGLTMKEAVQSVSGMDVKEYSAKAAQIVADAQKLRAEKGRALKLSDFSDEVNENLRLYNATMRINRLEMLKSKIGLELTQAGMHINADLSQHLEQGYQDEIKRQAGILGESVSLANAGETIKTVSASTGGATFSQRIWANQAAMKGQLDGLLTQAMIRGDNPRVAAAKLKGQVADTVNNRRYVTERIARTEMARVQDKAQMDSFGAYGYKYCKWIAEPSACSICLSIATDNGGVYKISDAPDIPVHANCRCSKSAWYKADSSRKDSGALMGALNDDNDPSFSKRFKFAEDYYNELRNSDRSAFVDKAVKATGLPDETVALAFEHVLDSQYELDTMSNGTELKHFDPSYDMAQSLQRLRSGHATKLDVLLIQHEAMEAELMDNKGFDYKTAHAKVNKLYNYGEQLLKEKEGDE